MTRAPNLRSLLGAAAIAGCLVAAGCSSSGGGAAHSSAAPDSMSMAMPSSGSSSAPASSPTSAATAAAATITIKSFAYTVSGPAKAGAQVRVTNNDVEAHTVTADSGQAFGVTIQPGKTATFTAPAAGTYKFHCEYHSNMHGTLMVSK